MNVQLEQRVKEKNQSQFQKYKINSSKSQVKLKLQSTESLPNMHRIESLPEILKKSPYISPKIINERLIKLKYSSDISFIRKINQSQQKPKKIVRVKRECSNSGFETPSQKSALQTSDSNRVVLPHIQRSRNSSSLNNLRKPYASHNITPSQNSQLYISENYHTINNQSSKPPIPKITIHNKLKGNIIVMQGGGGTSQVSPLMKSPLNNSYKLRQPSGSSNFISLNRSHDFSQLVNNRHNENSLFGFDYGQSLDNTNIVYDPIDENQEIILSIGKRAHKLLPSTVTTSVKQHYSVQNFSYKNFLTDLINTNSKEIDRSVGNISKRSGLQDHINNNKSVQENGYEIIILPHKEINEKEQYSSQISETPMINDVYEDFTTKNAQKRISEQEIQTTLYDYGYPREQPFVQVNNKRSSVEIQTEQVQISKQQIEDRQATQKRQEAIDKAYKRYLQDKRGLVVLGLRLFRILLKNNCKGMLSRLIKKRLIQMGLMAYNKYVVKKNQLIQLKQQRYKKYMQDKNGLVFLGLRIFRILLKNNIKGILNRVVKRKLIQMSLKAFNDYKKKNQQQNSMKVLPKFKKYTQSKNGLVFLAIRLFRILLKNNCKGMLNRVVKKKLLQMSIKAFYDYRQKGQNGTQLKALAKFKKYTKDRNGLVYLALRLFRILLKNNCKGMLNRVVKKKLLQMSIKAFNDYKQKSQKGAQLKALAKLKKYTQDRNGLVYLALRLFRILLKHNCNGMLSRVMKKKLIEISIQAFKIYRDKKQAVQKQITESKIKRYTKDKNGLVNLGLRLFRILLKNNSKGMLSRLLKRKLVELSLKHFRQSLQTNKSKLLSKLLRSKLLKAAVRACQYYRKVLRPKNKSLINLKQCEVIPQQPSQFKLNSILSDKIRESIAVKQIRVALHQKLIKLSINALLKMRIKMIFSNKDGLVNYSLELFREMARRNYKGMLWRMVQRKLKIMSVESYQKLKTMRMKIKQDQVTKEYVEQVMSSVNLSLAKYQESQKRSSESKKGNEESSIMSPAFLHLKGEQQMSKGDQQYFILYESEGGTIAHKQPEKIQRLDSSELSIINNQDKKRSSNASETSGNFIDSLVNQLRVKKNSSGLKPSESNSNDKLEEEKEEEETVYAYNQFFKKQTMQSKKSLATEITRYLYTQKVKGENDKITEEQIEVNIIADQNNQQQTVLPDKNQDLEEESGSHSSFYESDEGNNLKIADSPMGRSQRLETKNTMKPKSPKNRLSVANHGVTLNLLNLNRMTTDHPNMQRAALDQSTQFKVNLVPENEESQNMAFISDLNSPTLQSKLLKASIPVPSLDISNLPNSPSVNEQKYSQVLSHQNSNLQLNLNQSMFGVSPFDSTFNNMNRSKKKKKSKKQLVQVDDRVNKTMIGQYNPGEVNHLIKAFKDLDQSRQQMIIQALEPHFKSPTAGKKKKKKVKLQMNGEYQSTSDFMNHTIQH